MASPISPVGRSSAPAWMQRTVAMTPIAKNWSASSPTNQPTRNSKIINGPGKRSRKKLMTPPIKETMARQSNRFEAFMVVFRCL